MRLNYDDDDKVEVQMSPLIDCVFLLLIFFLVTTMMKKWEMQIPLTLPTMTSSLSTTRAGEEAVTVSYTPLTQPKISPVEISVVASILKKNAAEEEGDDTNNTT